tara:strand:+ start:118 stop:459 length:342 start_codon:yes stop_codon:yes gene_type:complete
MSNDKIDQLFAATRDSEPYVATDDFEQQLSHRLDQLDWPPVWLRAGLPFLGAILGLVLGLVIFLNSSQISQTAQLVQSVTETSLSLPFWTAGLISLFFTAAGLLGATQFLNKE